MTDKRQFVSEYVYSLHIKQTTTIEPYADTKFEYEITNNSWGDVPDIIEKFCVTCLRYAIKKEERTELNWHKPVYTFEKLMPNKYKYTVTEPNLD